MKVRVACESPVLKCSHNEDPSDSRLIGTGRASNGASDFLLPMHINAVLRVSPRRRRREVSSTERTFNAHQIEIASLRVSTLHLMAS